MVGGERPGEPCAAAVRAPNRVTALLGRDHLGHAGPRLRPGVTVDYWACVGGRGGLGNGLAEPESAEIQHWPNDD